jgi:hypothetical protein
MVFLKSRSKIKKIVGCPYFSFHVMNKLLHFHNIDFDLQLSFTTNVYYGAFAFKD